MNDSAEPGGVFREERREDSVGGVPGGDTVSNRAAQPLENWRRTAKLIEGEADTAKLMELTDQLIRELDTTQVRESPPATATSDSASSALKSRHDEAFAPGDKPGTNQPGE